MKNSYFTIGTPLFLFFVSCTTQLGMNPENSAGKGSLIIREINGMAATIFIDGKMAKKKTPLTIDNVSAGNHTITLFFPNHKVKDDYKSVVVTEGKYTEVEFELLKSNSGSLEITTEPAGMLITVNNLEFGESPVSISGLPTGSYTLTTVSSNYLASDTITINSGSSQKVILKGPPSRNSIIEYFSNTGCMPCPKMSKAIDHFFLTNPGAFQTLELLVFHADYPDAKDPFFLSCKTDQEKRIYDYYVPNGPALPVSFLNGTEIPYIADNEAAYHKSINDFLSQARADSVVAGMFFSKMQTSDSTTISGVLTIVPGITSGAKMSELSLYIALLEDSIKYNNATNGQKVFHSIFRGFSKEGNGNLLQQGTISPVSFSLDISRYWRGKLRILCFLQHSTTKKIYQAVSYKLN